MLEHDDERHRVLALDRRARHVHERSELCGGGGGGQSGLLKDGDMTTECDGASGGV